MSDKRYLGNIITQNPTAPAGNFEGSAAKGVWSLEEQLAYQKAGLWPVPGNAPLDITDVFSTYLYEGNSSTRTITNDIDLSGEGGLVIQRGRDVAANTFFFDTERGATKYIMSASTNAEGTQSAALSAFNSDGFNTGSYGGTNSNGTDYVSWTFRKAPKFFTCLTYTGDSNATQTVNHDLGSVPGMIIIKKTDGTSNWTVYHRSAGSYRLRLNTTEAQDENGFWATSPTDTAFTLSNSDVKSDGATYVAYLFAHNDGDGEFGPDGDQDIIKCGSYTGDGTTNGTNEVTLGFEPQWILTKRSDSVDNWHICDVMRGQTTDGITQRLRANTTAAESSNYGAVPTPTGFKLYSDNSSGGTFIYIAIRRGPLAPPTAGTEVFAIDNQTASSAPFLTSNFPVDMVIRKRTTGSNSEVMSRLTQGKGLFANATSAEQTDSVAQFDFNDGCLDGTSTDTSRYGWMWKRAPGYFDAVAYTGNGTAGHTVSHNLGVVPEMFVVKRRDATSSWETYVEPLGNTGRVFLNDTNAFTTGSAWNTTSPTATEFTLGGGSTNDSGGDYIAYLFASLSGISKVGSFTHTINVDTSVDCGFTSGARFVLIKRTDSTGDWYVFDTARGIASGNDKALFLNNTNAEQTADWLDPSSSGFIVDGPNWSSGSYIFYAIA